VDTQEFVPGLAKAVQKHEHSELFGWSGVLWHQEQAAARQTFVAVEQQVVHPKLSARGRRCAKRLGPAQRQGSRASKERAPLHASDVAQRRQLTNVRQTRH
jgi:hypothetical protein